MSVQLSLFHAELLEFLQSDVPRQPVISVEPISTHSSQASSPHLELELIQALSEKEFEEMGLISFYPRIVRGLPRLYLRDQPSVSRLRAPFSSLPDLKRLAVEKALFSLYRSYWPKRGCIALSTPAHPQIEPILRRAFPQLEIGNGNDVDLVVQTPPFSAGLNIEHLGGYGHALKKSIRSMGLHFLEAGILVDKNTSRGFASFENRTLLQWLFKTETPGPAEFDQYEQSTHFYFVALHSAMGGRLYLHALLKSLELDSKPIDLCMIDLDWFSELLGKGEPTLREAFGVERIEVWIGQRVFTEVLGSSGKIVRFLCPGSLSQKEIQAAMVASREFVAVRDDASFSEAVSIGKSFFYDGPAQAHSFVKDLEAVSLHSIASHRGTLMCLRQMILAFAHRLPLQQDEWVDEGYFQQMEPFDWWEAAQILGTALQDPDTRAGFKELGRILAEDYSCNSFIAHLVQRSLLHRKNPTLALYEEKQMNLFTTQRQSFKSFIQNMRRACQKTASMGDRGYE